MAFVQRSVKALAAGLQLAYTKGLTSLGIGALYWELPRNIGHLVVVYETSLSGAYWLRRGSDVPWGMPRRQQSS